MLQSEYDALNREQQVLVEDGYIEGYQHAIEDVEAILVRTGIDALDELFLHAKTNILNILNYHLSMLAEANGIAL
jgi:predicted oxidoreductase